MAHICRLGAGGPLSFSVFFLAHRCSFVHFFIHSVVSSGVRSFVCPLVHLLISSFSAARDCAELFSAGFKESGVYTVNPTNKTNFEVYCDMKTDGGGWTVFHKRFDGFVGFYRGWDEYKNGFGDVNEEYWLGNEKIHQLTEIPSQLRVEIKTQSSGNKYAKYSNFTVTNEASNYTLFVGFYSGTAFY